MIQEVKKVLDGYKGNTAGARADSARVIGCGTFRRPTELAMETPCRIIDIYLGWV
jgi:hypothetical protein